MGVLLRALSHSFHSLGIPRGFQDKEDSPCWFLPQGSCRGPLRGEGRDDSLCHSQATSRKGAVTAQP